MSKIVQVQEARSRLVALLTEVENGHEVVIARGDVPVARLAPVCDTSPRELGFVSYELPESSLDPLPADEVEAWHQ